MSQAKPELLNVDSENQATVYKRIEHILKVNYLISRQRLAIARALLQNRKILILGKYIIIKLYKSFFIASLFKSTFY